MSTFCRYFSSRRRRPTRRSRPRRLWWSCLWVLRCSVRSLMRLLSSAICTSGDPVSPSAVAYSAMMDFLVAVSRDTALLTELRARADEWRERPCVPTVAASDGLRAACDAAITEPTCKVTTKSACPGTRASSVLRGVFGRGLDRLDDVDQHAVGVGHDEVPLAEVLAAQAQLGGQALAGDEPVPLRVGVGDLEVEQQPRRRAPEALRQRGVRAVEQGQLVRAAPQAHVPVGLEGDLEPEQPHVEVARLGHLVRAD